MERQWSSGAAAVPGKNPVRELAGGEEKKLGEREGDEGYPSVASVEARGGRRGVLRGAVAPAAGFRRGRVGVGWPGSFTGSR